MLIQEARMVQKASDIERQRNDNKALDERAFLMRLFQTESKCCSTHDQEPCRKKRKPAWVRAHLCRY